MRIHSFVSHFPNNNCAIPWDTNPTHFSHFSNPVRCAFFNFRYKLTPKSIWNLSAIPWRSLQHQGNTLTSAEQANWRNLNKQISFNLNFKLKKNAKKSRVKNREMLVSANSLAVRPVTALQSPGCSAYLLCLSLSWRVRLLPSAPATENQEETLTAPPEPETGPLAPSPDLPPPQAQPRGAS